MKGIMMTEIVKRFEIIVLRPIQIILLALTVLGLIKQLWLLAIASAVGILYVGIIGSKLHPLQNARELMDGPIEGQAAKAEAAILPLETKRLLISHACTRVGLLLGSAAAIFSWHYFSFKWYISIFVGIICIFLLGALLKIVFKTLPSTINSEA
jgi:hypothetical protein